MPKKYNTVFKRYEYKYLVSRSQRRYIEQQIRLHRMQEDEYGETTICNIYYDTPDYRLIRRSIEKPVYKEKLRLRSYGRAGENDTVFLELKKKFDGIVYKRRISLGLQDATRFLSGMAPLPKEGQIPRELEYFYKYYGNLQPSMYLSYDRVAWFSKYDKNLRVTFDQDIAFRNWDMHLSSAPGGRQLLNPGESVMEIKVAGAMPLWLVDILNSTGVQKTSFSKYGRAYLTILSEQKLHIPAVAAYTA